MTPLVENSTCSADKQIHGNGTSPNVPRNTSIESFDFRALVPDLFNTFRWKLKFHNSLLLLRDQKIRICLLGCCSKVSRFRKWSSLRNHISISVLVPETPNNKTDPLARQNETTRSLSWNTSVWHYRCSGALYVIGLFHSFTKILTSLLNSDTSTITTTTWFMSEMRK